MSYQSDRQLILEMLHLIQEYRNESGKVVTNFKIRWNKDQTLDGFSITYKHLKVKK